MKKTTKNTKSKKNPKCKKNYTHITVILDKSGSMGTCLNDTIGGFNQFLKTQKEIKGEASATIVQFDDRYNMMVDMKPLTDIEDLNDKTYVPGGFTALLDAIGKTINSVKAQIENKAKKDKPEKVIFVIITDGEENSSKEFNRDQIMSMIESNKKENNWEFVFIGANQDAIKSGGNIGINRGSTLNYVADAKGTQIMYCSLSSSMSNYRARSINDTQDFFDPNTTKDINK